MFELLSSFVADSVLIRALEERSVSVPSQHGMTLFLQGEPPTGLYIIRRGKASLLMKADNGVVIAHFTVGAGSILGLPAVVAKEPYSLTAIACEWSEVRFVEIAAFEELMQEQPCLFPKVFEVLAAEIRSTLHAVIDTFGTDLQPSIPRPSNRRSQRV